MHGDVFSHAELNDLFDRLPAALYRSSADGAVLAANPATARLLGFDSVDELLAVENAAEWAHVDPDRRQQWRAVIEVEGTVRDFRQRLRRRNGDMIWVRDTALAVYDADGQLRFYEGVLVDITAEVKAANASSVLTGILESTSDLVVVFDEDARLSYANHASRSFLGLTAEDVRRGPVFSEVMTGLIWEEAWALATTKGWSGEITLPDRGGQSRPLWAVVTVHDGTDDRRYVAAIARDLTTMKQTQSRLEELIVAKDEFVATVSHELRNPLTGVIGLAEELRDGFSEFGDGERHDLITLIAHQASEMMWLVDDLLVAARADVGEVTVVPETVDVVGQLTELTSSYEGSLECLMPAETLEAWVDPQRFRQILRNLLSNAARYGGENIRLKAERVDDRVVVSVCDDGAGVPPEDRERIFEAYRRSDAVPPKTGSVGLGLNVARRLARVMGGDIDCVEEDGWTTFRVSLPAVNGLRLSTP